MWAFAARWRLAQTDKGASLKLSGDAVVEDLRPTARAAFTPMTEARWARNRWPGRA